MTLILLLLGIIAARGDNNKNDCTGIKEDFPHLKQCEQKVGLLYIAHDLNSYRLENRYMEGQGSVKIT